MFVENWSDEHQSINLFQMVISHLVNLFDDCWLDFFMTCFEVGVISFVVRDRGLELESSDTSHIVNKDKWYTF